MISKSLQAALCSIVLTCGIASASSAQDIVYEPVNPNFGGNPFNSAHLLSIANAQNDYEDPSRSDGARGTSQADLFVRQLQSRLLSGLASNVTDAIFGDNPQDSGTIQFGSQTITFERGLTSIRLTIFDSDTGTTTEIEIPILNVSEEDAANPGNTNALIASAGDGGLVFDQGTSSYGASGMLISESDDTEFVAFPER